LLVLGQIKVSVLGILDRSFLKASTAFSSFLT